MILSEQFELIWNELFLGSGKVWMKKQIISKSRMVEASN